MNSSAESNTEILRRQSLLLPKGSAISDKFEEILKYGPPKYYHHIIPILWNGITSPGDDWEEYETKYEQPSFAILIVSEFLNQTLPIEAGKWRFQPEEVPLLVNHLIETGAMKVQVEEFKKYNDMRIASFEKSIEDSRNQYEEIRKLLTPTEVNSGDSSIGLE